MTNSAVAGRFYPGNSCSFVVVVVVPSVLIIRSVTVLPSIHRGENCTRKNFLILQYPCLNSAGCLKTYLARAFCVEEKV